MKIAAVLHWKTDNAPGLRCFSNDSKFASECVKGDGNDPDDLRPVGDVLIYWPASFGPFPDAATLAVWEAEYDARPVPKTVEERVAALEGKI
jgi:hypothetical protein